MNMVVSNYKCGFNFETLIRKEKCDVAYFTNSLSARLQIEWYSTQKTVDTATYNINKTNVCVADHTDKNASNEAEDKRQSLETELQCCLADGFRNDLSAYIRL